jgi:hypothetical protein
MGTLRYPAEVGYRAHVDKVMAGTLILRLIRFCLFNDAVFNAEFIIALIETKDAEC